MHRRFLTIGVLFIAVLFGGGSSSLLIASLCPHLSSISNVCNTETSPAEHHEAMEHEGTHEARSTPAEEDSTISDSGSDSCAHCAIHSRTTVNLGLHQSTETIRRFADIRLTSNIDAVVPELHLGHPVLTSRSHGPPGTSVSRHLLITVFRI